MLNNERLEIRILSFKGRTTHRDHSDINNEKKLANLFMTLKLKFGIDAVHLLKQAKKNNWFNF